MGSPAPAEAAENAELGVAVAEREGRGAEAARGAGPRSEAVFWFFVCKKMAQTLTVNYDVEQNQFAKLTPKLLC